MGHMGQWYRTDKGTGDREPVSESAVRRALTGVYRDVAASMDAAEHDGQGLTNGLALYDYRP